MMEMLRRRGVIPRPEDDEITWKGSGVKWIAMSTDAKAISKAALKGTLEGPLKYIQWEKGLGHEMQVLMKAMLKVVANDEGGGVAERMGYSGGSIEWIMQGGCNHSANDLLRVRYHASVETLLMRYFADTLETEQSFQDFKSKFLETRLQTDKTFASQYYGHILLPT